MPAIAWTYTTLRAALQAWPVHASNLYLANLDSIIGLGERRLWGDLNIEEYDKTDKTTVQMVIGTRTFLKPADTIQVRTLAYISAGQFAYLEKRSSDWCQMFAPDPTVRSPPQYYHELASDTLEVVPTPDQAYQVFFRYIGVLPESLTSSNPSATTWLSRAGPDALLAACLAEAEHFIKADDRYTDYINKYQNELLPRLRSEIRLSIRSGDYSPFKPAAVAAQ